MFSFTHRESGIKVAMKEVKMEPRYSKIPEAEVSHFKNSRFLIIVRYYTWQQKCLLLKLLPSIVACQTGKFIVPRTDVKLYSHLLIVGLARK